MLEQITGAVRSWCLRREYNWYTKSFLTHYNKLKNAPNSDEFEICLSYLHKTIGVGNRTLALSEKLGEGLNAGIQEKVGTLKRVQEVHATINDPDIDGSRENIYEAITNLLHEQP